MQTIYKGLMDRQQIKNSISMEKRKRKIKRKEREKMEKRKDELTGVKTIKSDSSEGFFTESSESSQADSEKETKKEKDERNFEDILLMNEA
jgi:hypothetical protein